MTLRIAYISRDWSSLGTVGDLTFGKHRWTPGGAGYYRCHLPAQAVNDRSEGEIEVRVFPHAVSRWPQAGPIIPQERDSSLDERQWDIIVLQRSWALTVPAGVVFNPPLPPGVVVDDYPHVVDDVIRAAQAAGQVVMSDIDDHLWDIHQANRAGRDTAAKLEDYTLAVVASDHVISSTLYLADVARDLGQPNVTVLANMIDLRNWTRQPIAPTVTKIGWVGRTAVRSQDLEQVGDAVRYYLREHSKVTFVHGGWHSQDPPLAKQISIPQNRLERRASQPILTYPTLWRGIDVAICPLNDIPFNLAKSAIKAMEASASGVPFVASAVGPYVDYGEGLLVSTPAEWKASLEALSDTKQRETIAESAYDRVRALDITKRWDDWATFYRDHAPSRLTPTPPRG